MDDIKVSMTSFIDFTLRPDSPKPTKVREIKYREYTPANDYWKTLRELIVALHKDGQDSKILEASTITSDPKKLPNYAKAIAGYKKFLNKHQLEWFNPTNTSWSHNNLIINVNPELGLYVDGEPHLIKLYFKENTTPAEIQLNKSRAGAVAYLMWEALNKLCPQNIKMSFLNVTNGQLVTPAIENRDYKIALFGSVNTFLFYWNNI
jgi:hypothetical protein